jgi:hypothetical protein
MLQTTLDFKKVNERIRVSSVFALLNFTKTRVFQLMSLFLRIRTIEAAKSDYSVPPVENSTEFVDNLWRRCGENSSNLWKGCGIVGEKSRQ